MAIILLGGAGGFLVGWALGGLLFGTRPSGALPAGRPARTTGYPGAAFLLLTVMMCGGVATGAIAAL